MSIRNGLFGPNGLTLPGTPATWDRFTHDEEALAEATACPKGTAGECCSVQCPAFRATPCDSDGKGRTTALRYTCHLKPNNPLAIGVVRARPIAHAEELR